MGKQQKISDAVSTRVYKYGIIPKGPFPEEAIEELWRANDLWNKLVAIDREAKAVFDQKRREASPEYNILAQQRDVLDEKLDEAFKTKRQARQQAGTKDREHPLIVKANQMIDALKKERKVLFADIKTVREKVDRSLDKTQLNKALKKKMLSTKKKSGLYSYTADEVFDYFDRARARTFGSKSKLRFHRFDGTGFYKFRFRRKGANVDGVLFDELLLGNQPLEKNNQRLVLLSQDYDHKKPRIRIRAKLVGGSTKDSRIFHEFDLIYHRPVPDGAQIQNAKILRERIGDRFTYHIALTVRQDVKPQIDVPLDRAIGIDLNFRRESAVIQVASVLFTEDDSYIEIKTPDKMMRAIEHIEHLESELDSEASDLGKNIKPLLLKKPVDKNHPKYGLWKAAAKFPNQVTLSFETAYKLARLIKWQKNQKAAEEMVSEDAQALILGWWRANSRKYRELHNLRHKQLLHRKHWYRQVACELVAKKQLLTFEEIDLSKFAEIKDKDNQLGNKARSQRYLASPSEFRNAIINAATRENVPFEKVDPAYTSKDCSLCGKRNNKLGSEKKWQCPHCGVVHDRDVNAARNIADRGLRQYQNRLKERVTQ